MGVLGLLVLVCLLCTIMSIEGLQHIFLWESSLLLCPVFQTGVFWICCKLSGVLWMPSILLVNHRHWYVWGTACGECMQWHDITTCTSVDLALESHKFVWSNLSWHLDSRKASVVESIQTDNSIVFGSALLLICLAFSLSLWNGVCRTTATAPTSSQWGSSSVPTSLTFLCFPPLFRCLGPLSMGPFCLLQHLGFQCPNFPHPWQWSSLAGHDDLPGGWDFVQHPNGFALSAGGFLPWRDLFCLRMALTVFCSCNPMASRLSEMAMCVRHTSSILDIIAIRSRASSFLTSSLSLRAVMNLYLMFCSFSSSVGKLHQWARAQRQSTSSSGDSSSW